MFSKWYTTCLFFMKSVWRKISCIRNCVFILILCCIVLILYDVGVQWCVFRASSCCFFRSSYDMYMNVLLTDGIVLPL